MLRACVNNVLSFFIYHDSTPTSINTPMTAVQKVSSTRIEFIFSPLLSYLIYIRPVAFNVKKKFFERQGSVGGKVLLAAGSAQTSIHVNPKIGVKRDTRKELPDDESGLLSLMFKSELFDNICTEIT